MSEERTTKEAGLHCLDGAAAPSGLAEDLRAIASFPPVVRTSLWSAVEPILADPVPPGGAAALDGAARASGVDVAAFAAAASALRGLYRFASKVDLPAERLAEDVATLLGKRDPSLEALVLSTYELARRRVQAELGQKTFAAHGKTLVDVDWRLELVTHSTFARGLKLPIVTLTLHYDERGQRSSVTLHALPTVLRKVRDALNQIVG